MKQHLPLVASSLIACAPATHQQSQTVAVRAPLPASSIRGDVARNQATSLDQMLAGRIAGVDVMPARGGGIIVRLQTPTSLIGNQAPLFVIDGTPVETDGTLSWLDPQDIEFVQALKNPGETAIYGVRGAHGVILIRTKGSH